jgi:hypothetical protein
VLVFLRACACVSMPALVSIAAVRNFNFVFKKGYIMEPAVQEIRHTYRSRNRIIYAIPFQIFKHVIGIESVFRGIVH